MFWKRVWYKPSFLALSTDARLLYIWSWTNPDASLSGLYECGPRKLARVLRDDAQATGRALRELEVEPLALYDAAAEVLWVVGRVEHVLRSPTQAVRMGRDFAACPPTYLRQQFAVKYGKLLNLDADG